MNLYECLEVYKKLTSELIDKINSEEELQGLIEKRAEVIKEINKINFPKEEFIENLEALNILELDNKLQALLKQEKNKTKNQIDILRKTREARKIYSKAHENPRLFSAKG